MDISLDLGALKRFLKIRENSPLYDNIKEQGGIGIPTLIINDQVMVDIDKEELERVLG